MHRRHVGDRMIDRVALQDEREETGPIAWCATAWLPAAVAAVDLALVALALIAWIGQPAAGEDSLEAGFARDMIVHHDQAVAMALAIRDRDNGPDPESRGDRHHPHPGKPDGADAGLAERLGPARHGHAPHMAWMGHPTAGLMPGMASPEELAAGNRSPVRPPTTSSCA